MAASIDSKLTPEMKLLDADNRVVAASRAAPLTDGLLDVMLAERMEITRSAWSSSAHQIGGPELFYRLRITTAPWIDTVFPPMVEPGKEAGGHHLWAGTCRAARSTPEW